MKSPEVLAPAGSPETLIAALRSGADAVYVGGKRFSARNSADNFSDEELAEAARLCHKYGAKLDLAVNTVISDSEADDFCTYIKYAASVGVDAFIILDIANVNSYYWVTDITNHQYAVPNYLTGRQINARLLFEF